MCAGRVGKEQNPCVRKNEEHLLMVRRLTVKVSGREWMNSKGSRTHHNIRLKILLISIPKIVKNKIKIY